MRAVGAIADDRVGDDRHRLTVTQWTRQTDGGWGYLTDRGQPCAAAVYVAVLFLPLALATLVWSGVSHWCRLMR
jgi:hypothetical protein